MTFAGGVVCRDCNISAATRRVTLPATRQRPARALLRCQWCAKRLAEQSGVLVEKLPYRAQQLRLPVGGEP